MSMRSYLAVLFKVGIKRVVTVGNCRLMLINVSLQLIKVFSWTALCRLQYYTTQKTKKGSKDHVHKEIRT